MSSLHLDVVRVSSIMGRDEFTMFGQHEVIFRPEANEGGRVTIRSKFSSFKVVEVEAYLLSDSLADES